MTQLSVNVIGLDRFYGNPWFSRLNCRMSEDVSRDKQNQNGNASNPIRARFWSAFAEQHK
jgi:hypothetical protein